MVQEKFACLTYHAVGNASDQYTVSDKQLGDHLSLLQAEGFLVEGFEQLETHLRLKQPLPGRYAILTLDDGDSSSMRAAEIIASHNCTATFFVTRDRSQKKPGYIREPEIRELRRLGFSLGTHGATHRKLTFVSESECLEELKGSKKWLEDTLGEPVCYMAAPGGYINSRIMHQAQDCGYLLIGTCNEWMNSTETMSLPAPVNRVNVRKHFSERNVRQIVDGSLGFYLWRQARSAALALPKQIFRD